MTTPLSRTDTEPSKPTTCADCEYFDDKCGDCLNPSSGRFQTTAFSQICRAFYPDTTAEEE